MIAAKLTGSRCRCGGCGEVFNSLSAFDAHRVGPYRQWWEPVAAPDRRCLTAEQMAAKGMALNVRGYWVTETRAARKARSVSPGLLPVGGDRSQPWV